MPITLHPRAKSAAENTLPIELPGLLPTALRGQSLAEIERWLIHQGRHQVPLAECFAISGSSEDLTLVCEGDFSHVHFLGREMREGTVRVVGDAGRHVGSAMSGGEVIVEGNVDDWAGAEMRGGTLDVQGKAGDHLASAYPGSKRGMAGGYLFVRGNCGRQAAYRQRRGVIAIGGDLGEHAAVEMIAGSLFVFGQCAHEPGIGMRRGTIVCLNHSPNLLPTFQPACRYKPAFLRFYLRELQKFGFPVGLELLEAHYFRMCGDLASLGKGEILYRL